MRSEAMLNRSALARALGVSAGWLRKHAVPNPTPVSMMVHYLVDQPDWLQSEWYRAVDLGGHSRSRASLERLSKHPWPVVRRQVAANVATPPDADASLHVRRGLLGNRSVPVDVLRCLVADNAVMDGHESYLANNGGAPIDLREGIDLNRFDKKALGSMMNLVLEVPIFAEGTGKLLPGVAGPGEKVLGDIVDEGGGPWWSAPARDLLCTARRIVDFDEAGAEVFTHLAEEVGCSLPELVGAIEAVLR
jgi:hypothetical protein